MLIGGDFHCVLQPADTTGQYTSRALSEIVRGLNLTDTWQQDPQRPSFTHHSPSGSTRIDRFYANQEVMARKTGIEILPAALNRPRGRRPPTLHTHSQEVEEAGPMEDGSRFGD
jgi:hypothetical protein